MASRPESRLELEPFREPELRLEPELELELRLEPEPEPEPEPELRLEPEPELELELRRELELELAAALRRELEPELRLELLPEPDPLFVLEPLPEPEALFAFEPLPEADPLLDLERLPELELFDLEPLPELELLDVEPLPELEPDPPLEPEPRLLSSSSAKIKLLRSVCRGPRLADRQALHQPLLLPLALLWRQPAVLGVEFQLQHVALDRRRIVELAIRLFGDLLHNPGHAANGGQRKQHQFLEQPHQAAPASSTNECGGKGPV